MKKSLKDLIVKLKEVYPCYDISTKNFLQPDVQEKIVDGEEVRDITYSVIVQTTVFTETIPEGQQNPRILVKVDGVGEGKTRIEAVENATIHSINQLGVF